MLVLGIETSCDETAASVVKDGYHVLSNVISSSQELHRKYGGIVPEIASRRHVEKINIVIEMALTQANVKLEDLDLIAVTRGPGLIGSLLTGVTAAKFIGFVVDKPVIGVNHVQAHLFSSLLGRKKQVFPAIGLVASGGHTSLVYIKDYLNFNLLGDTLDDAAGEALDKVAKLLKLGYPGGPVIEKLAKYGGRKSISFPIGLKQSLDFSFSGVKTAVLYYVKDQKLEIKNQKLKVPNQRSSEIADICASFQNAIINALVDKIKRVLKLFPKVKFLFTGGGVIANNELRNRLLSLGEEFDIKILFPARRYCTDNAAMIAGLGFWQYSMVKDKENFKAKLLDFEAVSNLGVVSV